MARITIEDCFKKVSNKFELSILASYRAKEISKGATTELERRNDKNSVISLREIASEYMDIPQLRQAYVQSLRLCVQSNDAPVEDRIVVDKKTQDEILKKASSIPDELIENEIISLDGEDSPIIDDLEIDSADDLPEQGEEDE